MSTPRLGIAHLTMLDVPPPELVSVAADAGFDFIGIRVSPATFAEEVYPMSAGSPMLRETVRRMACTGVRVTDIEVFALGPETGGEAWLPILESGAELGARMLNVVAADDDLGRLADNFAALAADATRFGLRPALEPITYRQVNSIPQAVEIASSAPGGAVLVDALHFHRFGGTTTQLAAADPALFPYAQVCDAPLAAPFGLPRPARLSHGQTTDGSDLQVEARAMRMMPGDGELPLRDLVRALPTGIPLAVEAPMTGYTDTAEPLDVAKRAHASLIRLLST